MNIQRNETYPLHFFEIIIQLCSFCTSYFFTHFLQIKKEQQTDSATTEKNLATTFLCRNARVFSVKSVQQSDLLFLLKNLFQTHSKVKHSEITYHCLSLRDLIFNQGQKLHLSTRQHKAPKAWLQPSRRQEASMPENFQILIQPEVGHQ